MEAYQDSHELVAPYPIMSHLDSMSADCSKLSDEDAEPPGGYQIAMGDVAPTLRGGTGLAPSLGRAVVWVPRPSRQEQAGAQTKERSAPPFSGYLIQRTASGLVRGALSDKAVCGEGLTDCHTRSSGMPGGLGVSPIP